MLFTKFLQDNIDEKQYNEALKKDEENWKKVIQNRLQGRALSRLLNSINKKRTKIVTDGAYYYKIINGVRHWLSTPPDTYEK